MDPNPGIVQDNLAPPPAHSALTARLTQLRTTHQVVADAVSALNAASATPLAVALLDTPIGSDYLPAANLIVLSGKYAAPASDALADKLILYRLTTGLHQLPLDVHDAAALQAYNLRQQHLWRLANPTPGPAPDGVCRFYQGTNRENFFAGDTSIAATGLQPDKAGSGIGCKRWEKHTVATEYKDQGWHTVTLSFDVALSYARQHTEWAMGMKEHEPALRDVADHGGLVLSFDVPESSLTDSKRWRPDKSGDSNNWQTTDTIAPDQIQKIEQLAVPGPLTKAAPPPTVAQIPAAQRQPTASGTKRRLYPTNFS
ncbi:hypothetical protein [Micromonospora endophytica]|uniref:Uncharacterized protein n=1 Tax=Micromonospora endophytica TaxID=515350 RepID=A0A2W2BVI8_9ACTN|nr:hypothetical protein [Micromonospora endophytica]PZF83978.1 hypothetical protein C1I93_29700 [Micromonospora endophytica]RIW43613.1 hypothetical protein D3H59_19675 [Micromonospora endophytica]